MEIFWKTIALYNASTWGFQLAIVLIGIVLTVLLASRPGPRIKLGMKIYLAAVCFWLSVVYYYVYCSEREYYQVMAIFWGIMALMWVWDAATGYTAFERTRKYDLFAYLLFAMPFVYPLVSMARGLSFPEITSPVMPCSVTVFMIGLLLYFSRNINLFIVLFLFHWSLIGLSKTYTFNIPEDLLLVSASIPALYLFFREYFANSRRAGMKPDAKYVNALLILVCVAIGGGALVTTLRELFFS